MIADYLLELELRMLYTVSLNLERELSTF